MPRTGGWSRKPIDMAARRYFVYLMWSVEGDLLYIGRSRDPVKRLQEHRGWDGFRRRNGADGWAGQVAEIDAWGPYTWDQAKRHERAAIRRMRPLHNIAHAS